MRNIVAWTDAGHGEVICDDLGNVNEKIITWMEKNGIEKSGYEEIQTTEELMKSLDLNYVGKMILNKTSCYTIGHMQYADGRDWRKLVSERLSKIGITVFDPYHKPFVNNHVDEGPETRKHLETLMQQGEYDKVQEIMWPIRSFDLRLCDLSTFVIAHIIPEVASWGTAEELVTSVRMKKPIFLSIQGGKKKTPLWIMAQIPHKYIYDSIEDVLDMIEKIDSGEVEIDSERWKLLLPEFR